jgi:hypothetical protein
VLGENKGRIATKMQKAQRGSAATEDGGWKMEKTNFAFAQ